MTDSILDTIKGPLGIQLDDTVFDPDLIMHINSALFDLRQLGVGPTDGFSITGKDETWTDLLGETKTLEAVKSYIQVKVKMVFDPPNHSYVIESFKRIVDEWAWRICKELDPDPADPPIPEGE